LVSHEDFIYLFNKLGFSKELVTDFYNCSEIFNNNHLRKLLPVYFAVGLFLLYLIYPLFSFAGSKLKGIFSVKTNVVLFSNVHVVFSVLVILLILLVKELLVPYFFVQDDNHVQFFPKIMQALQEAGGNTVTFLGLSFKPKTSDIREAPALALLERLLAQGIHVKVFDPLALEEARKVLGEKVIYCSSIEESVIESNAIILATEWDEFRNADFAALGRLMKTRILFDGRNIYEPASVCQEGFQYYGVGRR